MGKVISVRLTEESLAGIRARVGDRGRSGFIQDAIDAALGGDAVREKKSDVLAGVTDAYLTHADGAAKPVKPTGGNLRGDYAAVLSELDAGPRSMKPMAREMGWAELRLDRVLMKMAAAGLVRYVGGVAERV